MAKSFTMAALVAAMAAAGCTSQAQFLQSMQMNAMQTAVSRGQFEMNCPAATPTLISQEVIQPALQGPFVNGIQRAEYTIGVAGCGQRKVFVVLCPEGGRVVLPLAPGRSIIGEADGERDDRRGSGFQVLGVRIEIVFRQELRPETGHRKPVDEFEWRESWPITVTTTQSTITSRS
jgi:hypothetical protein